MVYEGPSRGCQTCRTRRIKCDGARPQCQNCVKRSQQCPGYRDEFDVMHKDQSASIPEQFRRRQAVRDKRRARKEVPTPPSRALQQDTEVACLCFYFTNYVTIARDPQATANFLELLLPIYTAASHDSPLSLVTSAIASNFASLWSRGGPEPRMATTFFGRALEKTKAAIDDPQLNTTDEMLMTVLMLEHYEEIAGASKSEPSSGTHRSGAVALCKHRGSLNFRSFTSKKLLQAVRHQLIHKALENGESIPSDPAIWTNDPSGMPESPAIALDSIVLELVNLKAFVDSVDFPTQPDLPPEVTEDSSPSSFQASETAAKIVHSILAPALEIDASLSQWSRNVPTFWHAIRVSSPSSIHSSILDAGMYGTSCDVYPSLHVAALWNLWRTIRIQTLKIVLTCQRSLVALDPDEDMGVSSSYAGDFIQRLVDSFCASIPAHLGNRTRPGSLRSFEGVEYPHLPLEDEPGYQRPPPNALGYSPQVSTEEDLRIATGLGGWFLLSPIRDILGTCTPTAVDAELGYPPLLREGQLDWIMGQLGRVREIYLVKKPGEASPTKE